MYLNDVIKSDTMHTYGFCSITLCNHTFPLRFVHLLLKLNIVV